MLTNAGLSIGGQPLPTVINGITLTKATGRQKGPALDVWYGLSFKASREGDRGQETAHSVSRSDLPYLVPRRPGMGRSQGAERNGIRRTCSGLAKETLQNAKTHRRGQEICELENRPGPGAEKIDQRHQSVDSPSPEHGASEQRESSYLCDTKHQGVNLLPFLYVGYLQKPPNLPPILSIRIPVLLFQPLFLSQGRKQEHQGGQQVRDPQE